MTTMRIWMMTALAALLLAACGDEPEGARPADAADAALSVTRAGTPADSAVAAEAAREGMRAARDTGYTAWEPVELPSEPWMQRAATPAALLARVRDEVAAQLEEPDAEVLHTAIESESGDRAVALLVHPDLADDSVRDIEFRLHMRREGAEWTVAGVDRRERCRRGVTDGNLCA